MELIVAVARCEPSAVISNRSFERDARTFKNLANVRKAVLAAVRRLGINMAIRDCASPRLS